MRCLSLRLSLLFFTALSVLAHAENPKGTPQRIIPLLPSLAETVVEILGEETRIVGVSEYSDFPASLSKKPSIGPYSKPNLETIISLKPDLVLASSDGSPQEIVSRLKKIGIPVLSVGTESIEEVRTSYRTL